MNNNQNFKYTELVPARNIEQVLDNFEPSNTVDPNSEFYIPRNEQKLKKLTLKIKRKKESAVVHAFLCGHKGSGKTTELNRFCNNPKILEKYYPIYLTIQDFGSESVHLTHDALLVEITRKLLETSKKIAEELDKTFDTSYQSRFDNWGKQIVETFTTSDQIKAELGFNIKTWFAYFKAQLSFREESKQEYKQILEPKVGRLIELLNEIALNFETIVGKELLFVIDDLEKGESPAHKNMHMRVFQENYESLVQPSFSIIYTIPIYFRAMKECRIPNEQIFSFPAIRLYNREDKNKDNPPLCKEEEGYKIMKEFISKRFASLENFLDTEELDEIIRIGGGLFRETARALYESALNTILRDADKISAEDVSQVFNELKKEYQPSIHGETVTILKQVLNSESGWVSGIEPFLLSKAVVEYENGDFWVDLRHVLKPYIREIASAEE